jgi:phosphoribosyl-AMP cyclohydrolase
MNRDALEKTLAEGKVCFWSRSRNKFWLKGETSGNVQLVKDILVDCDADALVMKIEQIGGAACAHGYRTCFFRRPNGDDFDIICEQVFDPAQVYGK